jgi:hypothetical protein
VNGALRGVVLGCVLALVISGCIVRRIVGGPRLTGTCGGACEHYVECKPSHSSADRSRCQTECPQVFADRDSLLAFENLSCEDAVEFVDGDPRAVSSQR